LKRDLEVFGITPLTNLGDDVSLYLDLDYAEDIFRNFNKFGLSQPTLLEGSSRDPDSVDLIRNGEWDLIYVDGSHDFDTCLADVLDAIVGLKNGGILVIDDSSLYTDFDLSFAGHPGPSRVARDFIPTEMKLFLSVGHNNYFLKSA
jgi:hypothetical protein